jgi:hypothetical protein
MKIIELTQGKTAICDDEDYDRLIKHGWVYQPGRFGEEYARACIKQKGILMHRFILNPPKYMEIDHVNGNGLDNRKCNIRICTHAENMRNRKNQSNNTSGHKGVHWDKQKNKWLVYAGKNNKRYYGGTYENIVDACSAQDKLSIKLYGEFARILGSEV